MTPEELKAQLALAVKMGKEVADENAEIKIKAAKLEEANITMLTKFEALSKQIEDAGFNCYNLVGSWFQCHWRSFRMPTRMDVLA